MLTYYEIYKDDIEGKGECHSIEELVDSYLDLANTAPVKIGRYDTLEEARSALAQYKPHKTVSNGYTRYYVAFIEENTYDVEDGEEILDHSGDIWDFVADV